MSYTDVDKISDIKDTDGDKRVLHSTFVVTDINDNSIDISEKVNSTEETVVDIKLSRVLTGIYRDGETVEPGLSPG